MNRCGGFVAGVLMATMLVACSSQVGGSAVPDPDDPALGLDTGGFSTSPRKPSSSDEQQKVLAANQLSERIVVPWDVDPQFVHRLEDTGAIVGAQSEQLKAVIGDVTANIMARNGLLYGFGAGKQGTLDLNRLRGLRTVIVRLADEDGARRAIGEYRQSKSGLGLVDFRESPDVVVSWESRPARKYELFEGAYVVGTHLIIHRSYSASAPDARLTLAKAIDSQRARLAGFNSPGADEIAALPADKDGIVSRTVEGPPLRPGEPQLDYGFRDSAGQLNWEPEPDVIGPLMKQAGVDLVGRGRNTVYRAAGDSQARQFAESMGKHMEAFPGRQEVKVNGLSEARCNSFDVEVGVTRLTWCYVAAGRYVSMFSHQQESVAAKVTAAAYVVLRRAG